ncbi:uncharacterized protein LOC105286184 isoform X3 [Ooceraea biroi]|uniref:uncharacterized protein LOC105286184 isoform X3 n=1 Tax=Ooceraea biroi TaxID=2015173 RepID=UPI0009716E9A|nr:uncharacterized protein LOC105286184 isoform X3 [Ooceraea biroi]
MQEAEASCESEEGIPESLSSPNFSSSLDISVQHNFSSEKIIVPLDQFSEFVLRHGSTESHDQHGVAERAASSYNGSNVRKRASIAASGSPERKRASETADADKALKGGSEVGPSEGQNKQDIQASRASKIRYSYSDKPPYSVFIQPTIDNKESFVHPRTISRVLSTITPIELIEVKKTGRGRVVADFRTFSAANSVINHPELTKLKLKAYIPEFKVLRSGIIKDVPQSLDMATMIKHMESSIKVVDVERLNRRITADGQTQFAPSRTLKLRFAGQSLPKNVYLFKVRHEVTPFLPKTRICYTCFRVGHVSSSCKGKPRCITCGKDKHTESNPCLMFGFSVPCHRKGIGQHILVP